jgi:DeoR/GlpR family transcriptional regulator of sugar metabolism
MKHNLARQVVVVADSSKLGLVSPAVVCPAQKIDLLIPDNAFLKKRPKYFRRAA